MVHIKKVEIFGFKSFGFKNTIVDFEPGLMSISGPNGSGKSNILDAITFALGENKPTVMRAPSLRALMHDIDGAARRGPKLARSSVHFDNTDRKIPVDSDIVTITREMSEKGENIYYLNKVRVLRNKILDLMNLANAGLNQINNVQQGTVQRISEMNGEEKRQVIEDLVGLSDFDEKKKDAEKQLSMADQKLAIALAKMGEVKKRIDELEEDRNNKLRHDLIERELNRYKAISAASNLQTIKHEKSSKEKTFNSLNSEKKHFDEERAVVRKQRSEIQNQKDEFMGEISTYNKAKSEIEISLSTFQRTFDQSQSNILTSTKRLDFINDRLPELSESLKSLTTQRDSLELQTDKLKASIRTLREKKSLLDEESKNISRKRNEVLNKQSHISKQKLDVDKKLDKLANKRNHVKLLVAKLDSGVSELEEKILSNKNKQRNHSLNTDILQKQSTKLERVIQNHKHGIFEHESQLTKFQAMRVTTENEINELTELITASSKGADKYETKIKFAKGIMHEDYSISKLKHDSVNLGIEGLAYEIITWDKKYERASLAVCADWIKAVIVKDFSTLVSLAEFVHEKKLPKLKIIPLESIPDFKVNVPDNPGVIGLLSDHVSCDSKFKKLKTFLFGNVILAESRDSAIQISKSGFKTITLEGEFFEAQNTSLVIDTNSKISKLTKIINMSDSVDGLQSMISSLRKTVQKKKARLKKIDGVIKSHEKQLSISESEMTITNNSYTDLGQKLGSVNQTFTQFTSRNNKLERTKERLARELVTERSQLESIETQIKLVKENYAEPQIDSLANELTLLNDQLVNQEEIERPLKTELKESQDTLATLMADQTRIRSERHSAQNENSTLNQEKYTLEVGIRKSEKDKAEANNELIKLREQEQELISTSGTSVEKQQEFDTHIESLRDQIDSFNKEISNRDRKTDSLERDLRDLTGRESKIKTLLDKFGFNEKIEVFDVESIINSLEKEQERLKPSLNSGSPLQYIQVSVGYKTSSDHKNTLQQERNKIVAFIESVEKDKRQTFLDAFDTVDKQVRDAFSKMTGGNAWLELENEDDIFASGLNYLLQFPNKPKRESTSISGGEKSLAATVFVLALQKLNPSPFYMFDEVDAHLDAPNAEKLSKIIKERSEGSQFIMVSLKDSVVEKAKLIYGVFPKHGVSHVLKYKDKRGLLNLQDEPSITN
ncbi:MAG: chromosome segregation SMC family protein [Candidatus Nitrosopelagicus sp.]|nr:chromosome segregation SMC family protein [Candidatus Nitrosopelagicus sp.]